jgi:uncharacterized membrane protein YeiH
VINLLQFINHYSNQLNLILYCFMVLGVIASSISGTIRAIESNMDITGAILLAFLNSNAGGTIRDMLLGTKIFWIVDHFYIWLTFLVAIICFIFIYYNNKVITNKRLHNLLIITDAMGLAAFCLAGVEKSLICQQGYLIAIIMGIWTAIGGGVISDIISNRIPLVFSKELYIIVALIGAITYIVLVNIINLHHAVGGIIAAIIMISFRLYSIKYKLKLPLVRHN